MFFEKIKIWDDNLCEQHVGNSTRFISTLFLANNINTINYIDIGSNVGKVYDVISRHLIIQNAWMFEGSPTLFNYSKNKYKDNSAVQITHAAISNIEQEICFSEDSLLWQLNQEDTKSLNLGLSKIGGSQPSDTIALVQAKKLSNILKDNTNMLDSCNFIKIDTESVDILILEDLITVLSQFKTKPVIEFEVNYNALNMTSKEAQNIIDLYLPFGYRSIDMQHCSGDGYLIPVELNNPYPVLCF